ncbi:MAG TPA: DUF222 domain-containing protein [Acidimicrobiales bacterium]
MPDTDTPVAHGELGAALISGVAAESKGELWSDLDELFGVREATEGNIALRLAELERRQAFRDEGATSIEKWATERYGISLATARGLTRGGEKAWDLPHLIGAVCAGAISFDKMRAVADIATPETDEGLKEQAERCTVRELADVARTMAQVAASHSPTPSRSDHERRFVRFNDPFRTVTAQLPAATYAEVRATLEAKALQVPTDGETPWDQRVCDALTGIVSSSNAGASSEGATVSPNLVVVHVPLEALVDDAVEATELAGELERDGLIDCETVQRLACDATIAIAVDDDAGHTMYEGRARRFPTDAQRREVMRRDRHCRFPGCTNVTFTNVHHIVPWEPGGKTDLDNLALMCLHHHHVVHSNGWSMSGSPNEELQFAGPSGRPMASRPSPLWTRATAARRSAESDRGRSAAAAP